MRTVRGSGELKGNGSPLGLVSYDIHVKSDGRRGVVEGTITGQPVQMASAANSGNCTLEIEGYGTREIIIPAYMIGSDSVAITLSGELK